MKLKTILARLFALFVDSDPAAPVAAEPAPEAGNPAAEPEKPAKQEPAPAAAADVKLDFRFGGFDGSRAVEDARVQVGNVRMTKNGMTFKWTKGDLSAWGLARTEAGALACFFYWDANAKKWVGGKADWLSTSRTSRDFKNIKSHYNGWNDGAFFGATRHAFCVCSKDGKRRTNLAEAQK